MVNCGTVSDPAEPLSDDRTTPRLGQGEPGAAQEFAIASDCARNVRALSAVCKNQGVGTVGVPGGGASFGSCNTVNFGVGAIEPGFEA